VNKLFYGSSSGQVDLNIYLGSLNPKNYRIAIELENGKRIDVKNYKINDLVVNPKTSLSDSFSIESVNLTKTINYISMTLFFDPNEMGFATKFNVVVYDILTGEKVFELDPFLSGFDERYPINIGSTHSAIPDNYTHVVKGVDMSSWNCADNNSVAIGWHGTGSTPIEIDAVIEGTCGVSTDANILFMEQTLIPENTGLTASDTNGYYAYSVNTTRSNPLRNCSNVYLFCDNFEDGAITGWSKEEGAGTNVATTDQAIEGVYSMTGDQETAYSYALTIAQDQNISSYIRITNTAVNGSYFSLGYVGLLIGFNRGGFTNKFAYYNGSSYSGFNGINPDIQADKWYKFTFQYKGSNISDLYVFDTDGQSLLGYAFGVSHNAINNKIAGYSDASSDTTYYDYITQLQGVAINPEYTIGTKEEAINDFNIVFNVYQQTGFDFDLNNFNIDFNVDAYDQTGVNSPVTINDVNVGTYSITISKTGWDSNSFELTVDANKNLTYYIDKFVYPTISQFEVDGATTTSSSSYQNIGTFSYLTSYGSSTQTDLSCSFWVSSNNDIEKTASWRIQSSTDGINWTTRKETTRTISANTTGGSILIATPDFNIVDGTQYFRLQHKLSSSNFDLNTNDVICHNFIARDQNNFLIQVEEDSPDNLTTSATNYTLIRSGNFTTDPFNGFMYYYGDMEYSQTVAKGTSYIRGDLANVPDSNSAEYPRTTNAGSIGIGGFSGIFEDLNNSSAYTVQSYGKTNAGTIAFSYDLHLKYLNQKSNQYDQNKFLAGKTLTSNSLVKIATLNITPQTQGDFRAITVLPFSCSDANCDFNTLIAISGAGYDVNSLSHKRTSNTIPADIGVLVNQFLFQDVNAGSITVDLYASTSGGTITIEGGSFSVIKANQTTATTEFPPNPPMIYAPTNGADVNGATVDYNCFAIDPDLDALTYDVNIIYRDTNATAIVLETGGDGYGDFNSFVLANGTYSFTCVVDDGNFTSSFENDDYNFTITNVLPSGAVSDLNYTRYFASYDLRQDLNATEEFINDKLVFEESAELRKEQETQNLLIGIIILLGVVILLVLFVVLKGRK